ncbi:MAG: TatD family hydrolase [Elusimicrobia bacterium]|nr:TatD family hydrolase [Elusimicrobiota bacterium]
MHAPFFDTHAHLTDPRFDADRGAVLERCAQAGVTRVIEVADSPQDWPRALALARSRPAAVRAALGLHPCHAGLCDETLLPRLRRHAALPEVAAIGEIGLDYARSAVPRAVQIDALRRLLGACRQWNKPAVIHCRDAYPDLRRLVAEAFGAPPSGRRFWGVVHCFSGTPDDAVFFAGLGFALGADGPLTYPRNDALREAFRRAGPRAAVLETDSPYLPPQSCRGRRNEPANLPEIAASLASTWAMTVEETADITTRNGLELFGLS